jgi:hypothetical protein
MSSSNGSQREEEEDEQNISQYETESNENEDDYMIHIAGIIRQNEEPDPDLDPQPDVDEVDLDNFDDIYEVFRIHTSNAELFASNEYVNRYSQYENNTFSYRNHNQFTCPICNYDARNRDLLGTHLVYNHSSLIISLTSSYYPNYTAEDIQNIFAMARPSTLYGTSNTEENNDVRDLVYRLMFNDDNDSPPTYEELMELCEYIGYHKSGITDINSVSTEHVAVEEKTIQSEDPCIICLETLYSKDIVRKINKCGHVFCNDCIKKWFEDNKTCPLCKSEIEKESKLDQIDI